MNIKRIKSGNYKVELYGFTFDVTKEDNSGWVLWNKDGVEVWRFDTKASIIQCLKSYDKHGVESLDSQEFCQY